MAAFPRVLNAFVGLTLLALGLAGGRTGALATEVDGKTILETNCGRCHAIDAKSDSPLPQAPPLRKVYIEYPIDQLEQGFAEGMGSRHRDMPQIQFSDEQVAAILSYLGSLTGVDPASRQRVVIPGETPP
ncbi:MAG TPA: cytochrome c [Methyloceanibacter sp.]|nr:cytochrome c [Methyloceanibacter sp.]